MTANEPRGLADVRGEELVPAQAGKKQVRIGIFVIAALLATVYLLYLLTDPSMFRGRYRITTTVENALGLRVGDPVQMRGVTIGSVNRFEIARDDAAVLITLEVDGQWNIPEGSTTQLVQPGLMAPKTIEILPGPGPGTIGPGGSLPGVAVKGLLDDTESLGQMGQDVLNRVTRLLSQENLDNIGGSAEGLNALLTELSDLVDSEREDLSELIGSFNAAADGLAAMTEDGAQIGSDLVSTAAKADSLMDRLNGTSESVDGAMASLRTVLTRMENGEGTLGQLSANDTLYTGLTTTLESIRLLLDDIRDNPGRYINVSIF